MDSSLFTFNDYVMPRERWELIVQSKQHFLQDSSQDLLDLPQLDHAIWESWIRSGNM